VSAPRTSRHSICVFCASSDHIPEAYLEIARELGAAFVGEGLELIDGGGNNGLMGVLSETMHSHGGQHVGVITTVLRDMGFASELVDDMIVTEGMGERKAIMADRADAFIGLPGGFGTIEELAEIITLRQLGLHDKPIVILNALDFYSGLIAQFEQGYRERFIDADCRRLYHVSGDVSDAVGYILDELTRRGGDTR
jgi:cytokinin riboside 5'-monophosphate phosphoribohydrolase